ncbi:KLHL31 [Cordylochernes scorpioides]|uniref:KLHL31 n=1 Tax=Cordylochernes scorpioides TaxID=51811 RepID=A0ABY6LAD3_9ARAC|nr:KLHL31 [Cordylochernes scorpioides]
MAAPGPQGCPHLLLPLLPEEPPTSPTPGHPRVRLFHHKIDAERKRHLLTTATNKRIQVELQNVNGEAFEVLLTYMYTGRLRLTCQNLGVVYRASRLLQMREITHICAQLRVKLAPTKMDVGMSQILSGQIGGVVSTLYLYVTAKKLGIKHAWYRAFRVITSRFEDVADSVEFLQLDVEDVCEILRADPLGARSEVSVFLAALRWLHYRFLDRESHTIRVMRCVRFPLMSLDEVLACFHPPLLPGIVEWPELNLMLLRATWYVVV